MKKFLLTLSAAALSAIAVNGQTRLSLYEEFSGENCGPCAAYNPGLWSLLSANTSKVMLIKYQVPIPSAGPIYNAYRTISDARRSYYGVTSAPFGIQNGNEVSGNVANYTQANINASVVNTAPFTIAVTHTWNAAGDSITANVTITSPAAYTPAGANLNLRIALIEHLSYCAAPGNNGEKEFHNVVREMYPDANGTPLPNSWTMSQTQSITVSGKVPSRVDKSNDDALVVVWIQNDATKNIVQAAKSVHVALPLDAALTACTAPILACANGTASVPSTATLTNTGTAPMTAATIYYKLDNGAYASTSWTGTIAPGGNATVSIPTLTMTAGSHVIYDSVALPNGSADINGINNVNSVNVTVLDETPVAMPVSTDFENGGLLPTNWNLFDEDGNTANWLLRATNGHNSSIYALMHANYAYQAGEVNYAILPTAALPAGSKALDFYVAYAPYTLNAPENDKLEIVYSTNCGGTWTSVWSSMGADLATHEATTAQFVPAADDWKLKSIDMSGVPTGAILAFRATSDYGNNLYIDDVNLRSGIPTGVRGNVVAAQQISLFPNPATASATLEFTLSSSSKVVVSVLDALGRTVSVIADATLQQGAQRFTVPTSALAAGVYNIAIRTEEGLSTRRLSVVK